MKRILVLVVALVTVLGTAALGSAQEAERPERALPDHIADLRLDTPVSASGVAVSDKIDEGLFGATGKVRVSIRLTNDPVAAVAATGARADQQKTQLRTVLGQQAAFTRVLSGQGGKVLGATQIALNTVFVEIDASALSRLAANSNVASIRLVRDFEKDLSETVPYIGATAVQGMGYDGTGVTVAVLDSGIDYLHANLGGSGDPAEYAANDSTIIEPGTFPTAKVIGGYDFVGGEWWGSGGPAEVPDPDPLDDGPEGGHGTHVADIIGGLGGVAPGVGLYGVKVCSSQSTACSGIALIQGMDFALDPNGDGWVADHADVINMSLGSLYGTAYDDDLSQAVEFASALGVLSVTAAGNGSDKPYVLDTPSAAPSALSVAQTAVPSAVQMLMDITAPAGIAGQYPAVFQPWSAPLTTRVESLLQYADGAGGNLDGCAPFAAGTLTGKIVLVDRGSCDFSLKIYNIQLGGGIAGIIGMVQPGDPFEGGQGAGGPFTIPGFMISQTNSGKLKSGLPNTYVVFDPAAGIPLVQHMVGSSSRGPAMGTNLLKPEIGAPGASVSAIYGTGTETGVFGGTSGATPMVSGAAALLMQAYPARTPAEIKAVLMNTAETDIMNKAAFFGGDLAPISRIGGGEVRVDDALASPAAAWDRRLPSGGLSFGFVDVAGVKYITKQVVIQNYSDHEQIFEIASSFRFADDEASGALTIKAPATIKVAAFGTRTFRVTMRIDGSLLPANAMNSGANGANPAPLTLNEYDGYLTLTSPDGSIHLPWHVLPRQAAKEFAGPMVFGGPVATVTLDNQGVGSAQNDAYTLLAVSPDIPTGTPGAGAPTPDIAAVGVNTFPVPAGFCSDTDPSFLWAFAINSHERQTHLLPVSYQLFLDIDLDGLDDFMVTNADAGGPWGASNGQQLTWAIDLATGASSAFFYAEHGTNTGNTALYLCAEQVGLSFGDLAWYGAGTNVGLDVYAADIYYGGPGDLVSDLVITPYGEGYYGSPVDVAPFSTDIMTVTDYGLFPGNTPELGVLLFANGDRGPGIRGGATEATEAILLLP